MRKMAIPQAPIVGAKRKRAPVSYVDNNDDEIDMLLGEDEQENGSRSEDDPNAYGDDMSATFGSKKVLQTSSMMSIKRAPTNASAEATQASCHQKVQTDSEKEFQEYTAIPFDGIATRDSRSHLRIRPH